MSADPTEIHYRSPAGSESAAASTTAEEQVTATSAEPVVKWFRVVYRIGLVTIWTATMFSLWGIGYLVLYFSENLRLNWRQAIFRTWASMFMKILGATMEVDGSPPEGKFFLVANHLSYMDIPDLASKLDTSFVAKNELAGWPVIGALTRAMDTIYVDREDCRDLIGVNELIQEHLEEGDGVVLFPEGTSTSGKQVRDFNSPLLEYPAQTDLPVHYASLEYVTPIGEAPAEQSICFSGDMQFGSHFLDLLKLSGFKVKLNFSTLPIQGDCRKQLAQQLNYSVRFLKDGTNFRDRVESVSAPYRFQS